MAKKVDDDDGNTFDEITLFDEDNQQVLELSVSGKSHLIVAQQIMSIFLMNDFGKVKILGKNKDPSHLSVPAICSICLSYLFDPSGCPIMNK